MQSVMSVVNAVMLSGISTQVRGNGLVAGMMDTGNWGSAEKSIE